VITGISFGLVGLLFITGSLLAYRKHDRCDVCRESMILLIIGGALLVVFGIGSAVTA
jgi:hypothetical protein